MLAGHFRLIHAQVHDLALVAAYAVDQLAHAVAQRFHLLRAKPYIEQLARNLIACLQIRLAARAIFRQRAQHLAVQIADHRKALERVALQAEQIGSLHRGLLFFGHLLFFALVFFGLFVFLRDFLR